MFSRILVLFAFLMLTLLSAASAHEHGVAHALPHPTTAAMPAPIARPPTTQITDQSVVWVAATDDAFSCADARGSGHNNHGKVSDCACPAACAGLFDVATATLPLSLQISAEPNLGTRRLMARSAAPPTPPPRL